MIIKPYYVPTRQWRVKNKKYNAIGKENLNSIRLKLIEKVTIVNALIT